MNLNVFSTIVSTLSPGYSISLTTGASKTISHESGSTFITSSGFEYTGFFINCITLQESLFYSIRQRMSEGAVVIHENTFGSYSRIASELMESYLQREKEGEDDDSSSIASALPAMFLSLFSGNSTTNGAYQTDGNEGRNSESKKNTMQFVVTAIDYNLISLIIAIKRYSIYHFSIFFSHVFIFHLLTFSS